jgi:hypothetical protein
VVAAGRRDDAARRHVPQEEVRERPARLERPGPLERLELEHDLHAGQAEVCARQPEDRRPADVGRDHRVGPRDVVRDDGHLLDGRLALHDASRRALKCLVVALSALGR